MTGTVDAGPFSTWLDGMRGQATTDTSVPCGECVGCCTSSQFILVRPDDVKARSVIPADLLFPAPGAPAGHDLLGFDERGHCPMFADGQCSIYEDRPKTCRDYDCRIFPATGLHPAVTKVAITRGSDRFQFRHDTDRDETLHGATQRAGSFVQKHASALRSISEDETQQAVMALALHQLFLDPAGPTLPQVQAAIDALTAHG